MGRTAKTPGKPKGKMSAYTFYVQETREELKRKEPNKTHGLATISKLASEMWKNMSEKEKKKYVDMSSKDGERYKEEMASYTPAEDDGKKRKRTKKDPNAPKRAMSAFFCFANEERSKVKAANPKYSVSEISKELGRMWESLKDKSKYEAMAAKDRARYLTEKADYEIGQPNGTAAKKPTKATKKSKPPAKKAKRGKETEEEDEDDEPVRDESEEEEEDDDEDDGGDSD